MIEQLIDFIPSVEDQVKFFKTTICNTNVGYGLEYSIYYTNYEEPCDDYTFIISTRLLLESDLYITQEFIQQQFEFAIESLVENIFVQAQIRGDNCLSINIQLPDEELGFFFCQVKNNRIELESLVRVRF